MNRAAEVAIVKDHDVGRRTLKALELIGGIDRVVGRGDKVFLKPNLVDGAPLETGEVVQLNMIRVIIEEAFRAGATEVTIGEVPTYRRKTKTIEMYEHLSKKLGAKFLELDQYPFNEVKVKDPVFFSTVKLSKPLLDCDVFINIPTLKTHCSCGITVAIKNMYGLIPKEDRRLYHRQGRVEEAILDLYQARKADLTIVDGTYTTFHIGPRPLEDFKETFKLDLVLAGFDALAIDTVAARILGIDPETLRYLEWGEEKELGTRDLAKVRILGIPLEEAYFGKAFDTVDFVNARMKRTKILNYGACTGCFSIPLQVLQFGDASFTNQILFVIGPGATLDKVRKNMKGDETIVLCGQCAAPTFYNNLKGEYVPGCPPKSEVLHQKIGELANKDSEKG